MRADEMVIGEIYKISGPMGRNRILMVHDIKKCWYDKNGNAKTYTVENFDREFSEITVMNSTEVEEM